MFKSISMGPSDQSKNSQEKKPKKDTDKSCMDLSSKDIHSEEEDDGDINPRASDLIFNPESLRRRWLQKHGKEKYIDFSEEELE